MPLDLVKGLVGKTGKLHLAHRVQAVNGHADGHADDAGFRQGGIEHPLFPERFD